MIGMCRPGSKPARGHSPTMFVSIGWLSPTTLCGQQLWMFRGLDSYLKRGCLVVHCPQQARTEEGTERPRSFSACPTRLPQWESVPA